MRAPRSASASGRAASYAGVAKSEAKDFIGSAEDGVYVKLRVSPGAKSTGIKGIYGEGALRLSVAAPPIEGRANTEVERYLARLLGTPRSEITVVGGQSSREKLVFVRGAEAESVREGLAGFVR